MNKIKIVAGIALLSVCAVGAKAQKVYKEGSATFTMSSSMGSVDSKSYFKADSNATITQQGPAKITVLTAGADGDYLTILVDVPVANIKKAAVATPAEVEDFMAKLPKLTFTPGTETKQISGFNCKKVVAKDEKGTAYDVWVTNDITAPITGVSKLYAKAGGYPVQFTTFQQGQTISVTLKSIAEEKVPAGTFAIPAGYDKITLTDLQAMSGGKR